MYSYRFAVQHSSELFEVSSICLDIFSDLCDQRTCNLMKNCSVVDASCSTVVVLSCSPCVGLFGEQTVTNHMGVRINPKAQFLTHVCWFKMLNALDKVWIHSFCV